MAIESVGSSPSQRIQSTEQPVGPQREPARAEPNSTNEVTAWSPAQKAAMAMPPDQFAAEAPKLLLGLIPIAGPLFLLFDLFGKIAQLANPQAQNAASVIPDKANPTGLLPQQKKKAPGEEEDGLSARTSAKEEVSVEEGISGSFGDERSGGSGSAHVRANAGARADAVATAGPDGARAAVGARAEVGVSAGARGEIHGAAGRASAEVNAHARAYAEGKGEASVGLHGATVRAGAAAGAEAGADAAVCAETAPIVKLGDAAVTAGAKAAGYAKSGTGASCDAEATATFNPPEVVGKVGARAFAGARAGAKATLGAGPFKLEVGIDGRAGAGVEYGVNFGFMDGKLSFSGFAGIAAAIGLGTQFNLTIDFNQIGAMIAGIFGKVASEAPPGSPGQAVASGLSDFVKMATPFAAKALDKYSSFDLTDGQGGAKEESSATVRRFSSEEDTRAQSQRDADTERAMREQRSRLDRDLESIGGPGSRSKLDKALV